MEPGVTMRPMLALSLQDAKRSVYPWQYDDDRQISIDLNGLPVAEMDFATEETFSEASRDNPDPTKWLAVEETLTRADRDDSRPRDAWIEDTATKASRDRDDPVPALLNWGPDPVVGETWY